MTILTGWKLSLLAHPQRDHKRNRLNGDIPTRLRGDRPPCRQFRILKMNVTATRRSAFAGATAPSVAWRRQSGSPFDQLRATRWPELQPLASSLPFAALTPALGAGLHSSPIRSAAINASCGIDTLPYSRIRALPFFCFSSSFFLRVMSPP